MDASHAHSQGWEMMSDPKIMKMCLPSYTQTPPTANECKTLQAAISRIERFYTEGEDKQQQYIEMSKSEQQLYQENMMRITAQLKALRKYPESHTRRK